ncbi:MAG: NAD(P)H-dependent oxidoreductase subunit E, partial [Candidatus Kuenenia sp.]|nr:NAD(P)H-dependent oxidoreductase subunit E [Candidatus Kuenenia hertensis]
MQDNVNAGKENVPSVDLDKCRLILSTYSHATSNDLIPILQRLQEEYGYLS